MAAVGKLSFENARIMFRNFSGRGTKFNAEGKRNFCVVINDAATAQRLTEDGWNVRMLAPRDPQDAPTYYMTVAVSYEYRPPEVYIITGRAPHYKKTPLTEETIGNLDYADIVSSDIIIRPYNWEIGDKSGVKAYLSSMYVTIDEDEFAGKYDNVDEDEGIPF